MVEDLHTICTRSASLLDPRELPWCVTEQPPLTRNGTAKVSQLEFDRRLVDRLERLYATRDMLRRRELVRAALDVRPGDRILDVGCGPGFYVTELLEAVGHEGSVVGVDSSADMLAVAAKRAAGHGNVEFHQADATSLPVPAASFERAVCVQVLEYVRDVSAALSEMHRALRPGGRMLVWDIDWATVSWNAIDRQLARRVLAAWDKHLTHPSLPQTLAAQLRNADFQDVRMDARAFATTELIPDAYGGSLVPLLEQYVVEQGGMSQQEAKAWADEQRELGDHGEFFFTVTQFCFTATRRS
jgi:arsenite methyltransferase